MCFVVDQMVLEMNGTSMAYENPGRVFIDDYGTHSYPHRTPLNATAVQSTNWTYIYSNVWEKRKRLHELTTCVHDYILYSLD